MSDNMRYWLKVAVLAVLATVVFCVFYLALPCENLMFLPVKDLPARCLSFAGR